MKKSNLSILIFLCALSPQIAWMTEDKSNLELGENYAHNKDYAKAAIYFEQAVQNAQDDTSTSDCLYKLGNCYLEIAKESKSSEMIQHDLFEKTESILLKMNALDHSERSQLALARAYILHGSQIKNHEALAKGKALIKEDAYSKLLLALASEQYEARKKAYLEIIETSSNEWKGLSWYLLGLNELQNGQGNLTDAIRAFENAYNLFYPHDLHLSALSLKYKAEAFTGQSNREGYLKGLSELNHLILFHEGKLLTSLDDPGEVYYLRGLVAARLYFEGAGIPFGDIAEKSLLEGIKHPKGDYFLEAKKLLGVLYLKQKKLDQATEIFEKIVKSHSLSSEAAESLLWLSLTHDDGEGRNYLKKLYTNYPSSPFADEAYFRYYPFKDYLSGTNDSIEHLEQMEEKFPHSVYAVVANHLLGLDRKKRSDLVSAADFYEKAEIIYHELPSGKKGDPYFKEIAYQSALERALVLLELERMHESELILRRLVTESQDTLSPPLEKAAFHLVNIYIKEQNDDEAEKLIIAMLKMYEKSKIEQGYYFSRLWYDRGMIAFKENSPRQALQYFRHSETAAKGDILDNHQLLDLWIQQSLCYLELGEMDSSMQLLSRVTNYNATSSLRIKAMYLRAEIYEKQGRHELAKKQLQATSSKGGEWALKAKQKLEKDYVHQQHSS